MMSYRNNLALAVSAVVISLSVVHGAFANGVVGEKTFDDAVAAFSQRSAANTAAVEEALSILGTLESKVEDTDEKYDIFIMKSKVLYWKGNHLANDKEKMAVYDQGQAAAEAAKAMNDGYADAYYYAGINLARWGEANGIVQSLFKKDQLIKYMNEAMNRPTRSGEPGESIDGYGPDRTLGRVFFKLPALFGGSHVQSVNYFKKTIEDKTYPVALNVVYYAETLAAGAPGEVGLAKLLLDEMTCQDVNTYNPARIPETIEEFEQAKQLRSKIR